MRIEYLPDDSQTIRVVAGWLYGEWGHLRRGNTLKKVIQRISRRAESRTIPLTFIVRDGDEPVGTASLVAHDMKTRLSMTPWLASVYVVPCHRRRGFGTALCRRVVHEAKKIGYRRIYLFTPDKAEFYKGLDWREIQLAKYRKQKVTIMALE